MHKVVLTLHWWIVHASRVHQAEHQWGMDNKCFSQKGAKKPYHCLLYFLQYIYIWFVVIKPVPISCSLCWISIRHSKRCLYLRRLVHSFTYVHSTISGTIRTVQYGYSGNQNDMVHFLLGSFIHCTECTLPCFRRALLHNFCCTVPGIVPVIETFPQIDGTNLRGCHELQGKKS